MKIIVTPNSLENATKLINDYQVDILLLNLKNFSCRSNYFFSLEEIKQLNDIKKNTLIFVSINNFIFENQLEELTKTLLELKKINIDCLFFNDYSIPQICFENNINLCLHYNASMLVTSYNQFNFFEENNINSLTISNELFSHEVNQILENKNNIKLCMQAHGYVLMMHSRWELVSNFQKYINDHEEYSKNKIIFIKEQQKVYKNLIIEDDYGTHMFSGYKLSLYNFLEELKNKGLDYILLDTYLEKQKDYDLLIYSIYKNKLINNKSNKLFNNKTIIDKNYSSGFYGGIDNILHFKKINKDH